MSKFANILKMMDLLLRNERMNRSQLAKEIGSMAVVLDGKVDQIILTGGIAYNQITCDYFKDHCGFIAPITVYPGEDELLALAQGALRVMNGEEEAKTY